MELLQLKYFKDAAKYENFSKAAKENYVPQPSISKAVKNLEDELGVPLFDRKGKKIFLNDNGRYLYENTTKIFNLVDDCKERFSYYKSNIIKIYIQEGMFYIPKLVADYTLNNTNTTINYSSVSEVLQSSKLPYDFTFMQLQEDMSGYDFIPLFDDDIVLLVSTKHPLSKKKLVKLEDLKDENFVSYYSTISHRILSDRLCMQLGNFEPRYVYETHDENIVLHLVSENRGVTLMPEQLYNCRPYNNTKILHLNKTISSHLVLAWEKGKILSTAEHSFVDYSKKWFEENFRGTAPNKESR